MTIRSYIHDAIEPLHPDDTIAEAMERCQQHGVHHLPTVDVADRLVGMVSETQLVDMPDEMMPVGLLCNGNPMTVGPGEHPFEAARLMAEHQMTTIPVVDASHQYLGVLAQQDLFGLLSSLLATQEHGAIICIQIPPIDFSLTQLASIFEHNGVRIRSIVSEEPDGPEGDLHVTVKVNVADTTRIRHMLEHYGYTVTAHFCDESSDADLHDRVAEFLHYLEL